MLASTVTAETRVAGVSLYELKVVKENQVTIAAYSTLDGLVLGSAGFAEPHAKKQGFGVMIGKDEGIDKYLISLPGPDSS